MQFSLTLSRPAVSLWLSLFWRVFLYGLVLALVEEFIPLHLPLAVAVIWSLLVQPILLYGLSFWGILSKNSISGYHVHAFRNQQPVKSLPEAIGFSLWFSIEKLKYLWPFMVFMTLLFIQSGQSSLFENSLWVMLGLIAFSLYLDMLVLTYIVKRQTFGKSKLVVKEK